MSLPPGTRLGYYEILSAIGAGGMGEVYRARDTRLGRDVAIKVLPSEFSSDPERLGRFEREARVLASVNHPNVGAIFGVEDVNGLPALVLELVDGETLAERLAREREGTATSPHGLRVEEAMSICAQVAEGLEAAHEKGIIHRDLKPANIKIASNRKVKLLDFGLAKTPDVDAAPSGHESPTMANVATREWTVLGTAPYMSPEQARGQPIDKRTDIWAFGCVLYETLTGRVAFGGATVSDTIATILGHEPDWQALPTATPESIRRLLRRCLEKDRARRLRDIGEARHDIDEVRGPTQTHPTGRFRASWYVGAIVIVAVAAVAGFATSKFWRAPPTSHRAQQLSQRSRESKCTRLFRLTVRTSHTPGTEPSRTTTTSTCS